MEGGPTGARACRWARWRVDGRGAARRARKLVDKNEGNWLGTMSNRAARSAGLRGHNKDN
eukprot:11170927-Lingulodinium_polyedra.AAC.1